MPALRHTLHARFMSPLQGCDEDEDEDKTRYVALVMHTCTYRAISQAPHSAGQVGRFADQCGHVFGHHNVEIRICPQIP